MDYKALIKNFLDEKERLKAFPSKRKMKIYSLFYLSGKIEKGKVYTETEINDLLREWHTFNDPATLRREMYNCRILNRDPHNMTYTLSDTIPDAEDIIRKFG